MYEDPVACFCLRCGAPMNHLTPPGEDRARYVCSACGYIHYFNPHNIVGTVPVWEDKVLLCRRAIEPKKGRWTLPAGHQEMKEATSDGALRETWEEAGARVRLRQLFTLIDVAFASQAHLYFLADMEDERFCAGSESLEVKLFSEAEIPWNEIAFSTVRLTLEAFFADRKKGKFDFHHYIRHHPSVTPEC